MLILFVVAWVIVKIIIRNDGNGLLIVLAVYSTSFGYTSYLVY